MISATLRRTHYGALSAVLIASALAATVFAVVIGDRTAVRVDLTATRRYSLSERTERLLSQLDTPVEVVVSVSGARVSGESFGRVMDVLGEFDRRAEGLSVRSIDTLSASAPRELREVVERLAALRAGEIARHRDAMDAARGEAAAAAGALGRAAGLVEALGEAAGGSAAETNAREAETVRAMASGAERGAAVIGDAMATPVAGVSLPAVDAAIAEVAPVDRRVRRRSGALGDALAVARALVSQAERQRLFLLESGGDAEAAAIAGELRDEAQRASELLSSAVDRLARLGALEPLQLARALERTDAVLVVSERGSTAVRFESLFPAAGGAAGGGGGTVAGTRFAGERLLSIAIATATRETRPVMVLVHGEREAALTAGGRAASALTASMARLLDGLRVRGVDIAEWRVAESGTPPDLSSIDPEGERAVVWFVPGSPSRREAASAGGRALAERERRVGALGEAIAGLIDRGERVLVSLEPSAAPGVGAEDPVASAVSALGVRADVGRPLLTRVGVGERSGFSAYQRGRVPDSEGVSLVAEPLRGVETVLHWATPLRWGGGAEGDSEGRDKAGESPGGGVGPAGSPASVRPILEVADDGSTWGERRWLSTGLRWGNERAPLRALTTASPPSPDPDRDSVDGPWTVAVSVERERPRGVVGGTNEGPVQRAVIVSAAGWYQDVLAERLEAVDGRRVFAFPGNAELFDASFAWLCGDDELIAASPRTSDIARIDADLSEGAVAVLRWVLRLGLPGAVLLAGAGVYLLRR